MTSLLRPENVIHIKYIVTIFVIEPIVLHSFTGLRENSSRISRRFVFEARIADAVGRWQVAGKSLQRLEESVFVQRDTPDEEHTLMKPPSGFALRKAGCALTLG